MDDICLFQHYHRLFDDGDEFIVKVGDHNEFFKHCSTVLTHIHFVTYVQHTVLVVNRINFTKNKINLSLKGF